MRVLFITSSYPAHQDDPRGVHVHRIARALCREGVVVKVVTPGVPSAGYHDILDGVEVKRASYWISRWQSLTVGLGGIVPNLQQRPWLLVQVLPMIAALSSLALRLAKEVDVIHAHWLYPAGIAGVVAARRQKIPLVVTSHGGDLNLAGRFGFLRRLTKWISLAADGCIGVSHSLCEQFLAIGVPSTQISCIPCGVDPINTALGSDIIATDPAYHAFKNCGGFRLLYVGSLIARKSVETLLEAHHELEHRGYEIASAIVGPGPAKKRLQMIAHERSLYNIFFAEAQAPSFIPQWMSSSQVLVLPSLSEGRPVAVMEAMALGLPVVATDIPGTRELVRDRLTGLLFPPQDAKGLADCIERLIQDNYLRQEMGRRAQECLATDGLLTPQIARKHIAFYERVTSVRKGEKGKGHELSA